MRAYLIEPQKIFVPAISAVLLGAGLEITQVAGALDFRALMEAAPELIFADLDFLEIEPSQSVQIMRTLLPDGIICLYTYRFDQQLRAEYRMMGANEVFSKSLSPAELVENLRNVSSSAASDSHV
jgi:DNA-binding response OmpR family regulator